MSWPDPEGHVDIVEVRARPDLQPPGLPALLDEPERAIEGERRLVRRTHLELDLLHAWIRARPPEEVVHQRSPHVVRLTIAVHEGHQKRVPHHGALALGHDVPPALRSGERDDRPAEREGAV